jgi:tetratricopeptide (TPR) repeat protein
LVDQASWPGIEAALDSGDMVRAAIMAEMLLARGERHPMLFNLAAWRREEADDFSGAHGLLHEALRLAPHDPLIRLSMGAVMRKEGRYDEALALFARVADTLVNNPAFWLERGYAHDASGLLDLAAQDFTHAVELDRNSAPPLAALASARARQGRLVDARAASAQALSRDPTNVTAQLAQARCAFEAGEFLAASGALETLLARDDVPLADRTIAYGLLGDAHDRLTEHNAAFAAYAAANACFVEQHGTKFAPQCGIQRQSAFINDLAAALDQIAPQVWDSSSVETVTGAARVHAFLLGYPRSGTTLAENILASAAGVEALEERATLAEAERAFLSNSGGLAQLATLDANETERFANAYWATVAGYGADRAAKHFVDMDPLKGMKLPLIAKLFPGARVIVMRRDPRDVVWSCFRTNFALSAAAWEFTSLKSTARHYDALMRFMEQCFEALPLNVYELRYDDLVSDFDATTQALCAFLDLPWSIEMRAFDKTAQRRGVATASASQVRRGLYDGTKQWERYKAQMAPVLPILAPWVERFGFDDSAT